MKKLNSLTKILEDIYNVAQQILDASDFLYEEGTKAKFHKRNSKLSSTEVDELYKETIDDLLHDAVSVRSEKKYFSNYLLNRENEDGIPFFIKVWKGDMYGKIGVSALEMLLQDLKDQLASMNKESFFKA